MRPSNFWGKVSDNFPSMRSAKHCMYIILFTNRVIGVLEAVNKTEGVFSEADEKCLQTLADFVSLIMCKCQTRETLFAAENRLKVYTRLYCVINARHAYARGLQYSATVCYQSLRFFSSFYDKIYLPTCFCFPTNGFRHYSFVREQRSSLRCSEGRGGKILFW